MYRTSGTILALLLIFFGLVVAGLVSIRIWQEFGVVKPQAQVLPGVVPDLAKPFVNEFGYAVGDDAYTSQALPLRRAAGTAGVCAEMDFAAPMECYPSFLYDMTKAEQIQQMQNWHQAPGKWGWIIAAGH